VLIPALSSITADGLSILPVGAPGTVTVTLQGSSDSEGLPVLEKFLEHLHLEMVRTGGTLVRIDCGRLYFMNSSSVKCLVTWLMKIRALAKASRYEVHFLTNDRLGWQRRSFGTIHRSAPDIVTVSDEVRSS
jgi:hypothetical protein